MLRLVLFLLVGLAALLSAGAQADVPPDLRERIVSRLSQESVPITATFTGEEILIYGAVERNRFLTSDDSLPDIIISVRGPSAPVTVRKKERSFGVWMNRESVHVALAPSFYAVASTRPISEILHPIERMAARASVDSAVLLAGTPLSARDPEEFRKAVIRIRAAEGLYTEIPDGVTFTGNSLFQARIELPPNILEGTYETRVILARDGRVIDKVTQALPVPLSGFEREVYNLSRERPLIYGFLAVLVALFAGWSASEAFRLLRR